MKTKLLFSSLMFLALRAFGGPASNPESETYADPRAYAVYSAALGLGTFAGPPQLIDKQTVRNRSCVQSIGPLANKIEEAGAELARLERNTFTLTDTFTPPGKVELTSEQDAVAARKPPSMGWRPLTSFSPVGFSHDGAIAVVFIGYSCGSLCGSWRTAVFSKQEFGWVELRNENRCPVSVS